MKYSYWCEKCLENCEVDKSMDSAGRPEKCPRCLKFMVRDYKADNITCATEALHNEIHKYPYTSSRLPHRLEGCEHTPEGKTIVMSKSHEKEVMARTNMRRD